ncbi:hypothetical protein GQ457_12G005470 [Hibiscus cannabinus]
MLIIKKTHFNDSCLQQIILLIPVLMALFVLQLIISLSLSLSSLSYRRYSSLPQKPTTHLKFEAKGQSFSVRVF